MSHYKPGLFKWKKCLDSQQKIPSGFEDETEPESKG